METQTIETAKPVLKTIKKQPTMFESPLAIQRELQTINKDKKAFKGSYATIENVWESIRNTINANGFVVYHEMSPNGILTVALHTSGEKLSSCIPFSGNTDPQEKGKEITYARRYNIGAIFNLIIADDDNDASKNLNNYQKQEVNGKLAADKLLKAKNKDEARKIYAGLSEAERNTTEVIAAIADIKSRE